MRLQLVRRELSNLSSKSELITTLHRRFSVTAITDSGGQICT
jgi:hypothetical protein